MDSSCILLSSEVKQLAEAKQRSAGRTNSCPGSLDAGDKCWWWVWACPEGPLWPVCAKTAWEMEVSPAESSFAGPSLLPLIVSPPAQP